MYKIFQREHEMHLCNEALFLDNYNIIYNNPSKKLLEQLVLNLDDLRKKGKRIWIKADEDKMFARFKELFREVKAGGGAVFNTNGELLLIKRLGFWDLPKGKWQKGETIEQCAVREVEEECNVFGIKLGKALTPTYHLYNYRGKWAIKKSIWYMMQSTEWQLAKPQLEEDIDEIRWVKPDETMLKNLYTYPAIRQVIAELLSQKEYTF